MQLKSTVTSLCPVVNIFNISIEKNNKGISAEDYRKRRRWPKEVISSKMYFVVIYNIYIWYPYKKYYMLFICILIGTFAAVSCPSEVLVKSARSFMLRNGLSLLLLQSLITAFRFSEWNNLKIVQKGIELTTRFSLITQFR